MDFIMDHVSRKVGIQVGLHNFTDIDYADDVTLFVDTQDKYPIALSAMDEEVSKFGLHVSWSKTKIQNVGCGSTPSPVSTVTLSSQYKISHTWAASKRAIEIPVPNAPDVLDSPPE